MARPAELPPASFRGQQYVDSRGCVFLRAGIGGQVNWVARLSRDRTPLCGQQPSGRRVAVAEAAAPVPGAAPRATGRPMDTVASLTSPPRIREARRSAPVDTRSYVPAVPQPRAEATARPTPGCPSGSPHGKRARLADGRVTMFCSADPDFDLAAAVARKNGVLAPSAPTRLASAPAARVAAAPAPVAAPVGRSASGYTCPAETPVARRYRLNTGGTTVLCSDGGAGIASLRAPLAVGDADFADAAPPVPKGYKRAWNDDRLNPHRGKGTAQGQAAQDRFWTRDVPAKLVGQSATGTTTRSVTSASNSPQVGVAKSWTVQVGSFGVAANAKATAQRLSRLGLPVSVAKGGKLQIVRAGPFASANAAQQALSAARRAGFGDAYIR
ncbi:SPOR domain-containing protein [Szabonella alba]|uniref:SPOR domain-containing protein n=1 Tax=Szabonella alba TaxID=2804194 RepID=A0A8K0VAM3_9RHOB|nr:SPOR domain-containing protein [Szabonella alba]MBL4918176.1 SPOR domain-containing protein [Szabonella alba]